MGYQNDRIVVGLVRECCGFDQNRHSDKDVPFRVCNSLTDPEWYVSIAHPLHDGDAVCWLDLGPLTRCHADTIPTIHQSSRMYLHVYICVCKSLAQGTF